MERFIKLVPERDRKGKELLERGGGRGGEKMERFKFVK